jgi:choline monooxygenase
MPGFKEVQNFPTEADNLHTLSLENFAGNYFTRLSGDLSFKDCFGPMMKRLDWLPLNDFTYHPQFSKTYDIPVHWALYCENYLEGFHIPFVHPALNQALDFSSYRTELFEYSSLQVGIAKDDEDCFDLPPTSTDNGERIAAFYWFIFPNLMFNFYPWGLSLNVVHPLAPDRTLVHFHSFIWNEEKLNRGAGADVDTTEMEDEEIVHSVQQGIRSRFYQHGRYSVKHETGTHHFHRLIASLLNKE